MWARKELPATLPRAPLAGGPVVAISSNKGGVGKTTIATNLAVYLRAALEDLPVLLVSLDDQNVLDRMFANGTASGASLRHGWAAGSLCRVIRPGKYGVHYVPPPPDPARFKWRATDPLILTRILRRTAWPGLTIIDTKSDLEALTLNALHAADRIIVPISDWASLEEAAKCFDLLERTGLGVERGRAVLTLVDRRTRTEQYDRDLSMLLRDEIHVRGWPSYRTLLSRSPRVEALNSATRSPRTILHHAQGTRVHLEMEKLSAEVNRDLDLEGLAGRIARPLESANSVAAVAEGDRQRWGRALRRMLRVRREPQRSGASQL